MIPTTTTAVFTPRGRSEAGVSVISHSAFSSRRVAAHSQDYLKPIIERLDDLCALEPGWDGYAAPPVSFSNAHFALSMLASLSPPEALTPQIVPGPNGDLQVEWHSETSDIELHVRAPNDVQAWRFAQEGDEDGEELRLTTDFKVVARWLAEMAEAFVAARSAAA